MQSDFIEVYSSALEDQITLVKSVLENAGIQYVIRGDSHAGIPHAVIPTQVWVKKKDVQKARDLLRELL